MALTKSILTGRVVPPSDVPFRTGYLTFTLSGFDTQGADVLPRGVVERAVLGPDGAFPAGFALWRNTAGLRGTHYIVTAHWAEPDRASGYRDRQDPLGSIQVGDQPSHLLSDLLKTYIPPDPPGIFTTLSAEQMAEVQAAVEAVDGFEEALSGKADASALAGKADAVDLAAEAASRAGLQSVVLGDYFDAQDFLWPVLAPAADGRLRLLMGLGRDGALHVGDIRQLPGEEIRHAGLRVLRAVKDPDKRGVQMVLEDGSTWLAALRLHRPGGPRIDGAQVLLPITDGSRAGRVVAAALEDGRWWTSDRSLRDYARRLRVDPDSILGAPGNAYAGAWIDQSLIRFLADGEGAVRSYVQRRDIPSATAMAELAGPIEYIPETGESLSVGGAGGAVLTPDPPLPHSCLMFNSGVRTTAGSTPISPAALADFVPAREAFNSGGSTTGETPGTSMMRRIEADSPLRRVLVYRTFGSSGSEIAQWAADEQRYKNGITEAAAAHAVAASYGRDLLARVVLIDIGVNDRSAGTDRAVFKAGLLDLIDRLTADIGALNPAGSAPVRVILSQTIARQNRADYGAGYPALVQYEIARDRAEVTCIPKYDLPMIDSSHLTAEGYALRGERTGQAWRRMVDGGARHGGLFPTAFARAGAQIEIGFDSLEGPLILDTDSLPPALDMGFAAFMPDGTTPLAIASVTIRSGSTLRITLAADPGGPVLLRYALNGPGASGRSGSWGNLRDSSGSPSLINPSFTLRAWCPIFEETIA